jgi:hypothetical protein
LITSRLKAVTSDDGEPLLEFAEVAMHDRRDLSEVAISVFQRAWPSARTGAAASQRFRAVTARQDAERDYSLLDHAAAMAEYVAKKDLDDVPSRVRSHVAVLRAHELEPNDTHALAALAAVTRFVPDVENDEKRARLAAILDALDEGVGTGFLVSVAALLIDVGAESAARKVLDEVERRSPNNRSAMMVRARLS